VEASRDTRLRLFSQCLFVFAASSRQTKVRTEDHADQPEFDYGFEASDVDESSHDTTQDESSDHDDDDDVSL
jgi:hypothetical protein